MSNPRPTCDWCHKRNRQPGRGRSKEAVGKLLKELVKVWPKDSTQYVQVLGMITTLQWVLDSRLELDENFDIDTQQ